MASPTLDEDEVRALINFHALTLDEAQKWGIQTPLLRIGEQNVAWFFAFHVLIPDLNFQVLVARRYERLWSRTLGAELDRAADWIAARLPTLDRLLVATRRRRGGVGEADLILFDHVSGHVVVFEVKTVFDKFRTHLQLRNFTEQKANCPKALRQAANAAEAIRDGTWSLSYVFRKKCVHPSRTSPPECSPGGTRTTPRFGRPRRFCAATSTRWST